jgi:hypothetical protein
MGTLLKTASLKGYNTSSRSQNVVGRFKMHADGLAYEIVPEAHTNTSFD